MQRRSLADGAVVSDERATIKVDGPVGLRPPLDFIPDAAWSTLTDIGPRDDLGPFTGYSRVEERWDISVQPDGSARASVIVRREQHLTAERNWRFVARREAPLAQARRMRLGLAGACVAVVAAGAALWAAWTHPVPSPPVILPLPVPPAQTQSPATMVPVTPVAPKPVATRSPVPLIFPLERPAVKAAAPDAVSPLASVSDGPLDSRPAVRTAIARAFASQEAEAWSDDALTGFVVVGPAETTADGICRSTVILARGGPDGDRTISRRRCETADGSIVASGTP